LNSHGYTAVAAASTTATAAYPRSFVGVLRRKTMLGPGPLWDGPQVINTP